MVLRFSVYTFNAIDTCGYQIFWNFSGKRVRDYQIQNLVETEFFNIFEVLLQCLFMGGEQLQLEKFSFDRRKVTGFALKI